MAKVPKSRVRQLNDAEVQRDGDYVLYWMVANRRAASNFSLDHAVAWSRQLQKPLLVLEALRLDYPWASLRTHRFILQGMADNQKDFAAANIAYFPYVEPHKKAGKGLLKALAARACLVVTDDFPAFFIPNMLARAAELLPVPLQAVDSNGLMPIHAADKAYPSAYAFRRFLQQNLPPHLEHLPQAKTPRAQHLTGAEVPADIRKKWPAATAALLRVEPKALAEVVRHQELGDQVGPAEVAGGRRAGLQCLKNFLGEILPRYADDRNHPDRQGQSGLSPYLHFGNVSAHEVFAQLADQEGWTPERLSGRCSGQREGFWGMGAAAESFLDEMVTWRELGDNTCVQLPDSYMRYESLPDWAKKTLAEHQADRREHLYSVEQLARAETHDPVWNAAQNELRITGRLHNYMRMLWGKRILEWTPTPQKALAALIELNNRYAIDGRDSNSYSGIFWVLGRYDRPWPEHDIFGKVRMMTSASTQRKLKVKEYLARYGAQQDG